MGAIGDMHAYMQYQAAKSMRDAANQPAGEGWRRCEHRRRAGRRHRPGRRDGGYDQPGHAGRRPAGTSALRWRTPSEVDRRRRPAPEVMTLAEAAAYLKVDAADVQALITSGQVKAKQIGSEYRISKKALDDFLSA